MSYSSQLWQRAQYHIPGGVNSPVRAFKNVGGEPIFFSHGSGAYLFDVDGKRYIDYVGSWGAAILGHAHPTIVSAVRETAAGGLSFGAPTILEVLLAEKVCTLMPNIEMLRVVNSGTEATMSAIRLARGFTQRDKILKFNGCYHGAVDALLVQAGSGVLTLNLPDSAGIPAEFAQHTLIAEFNDLEQATQIFTRHGQDIAAVIVEPVAGNINCVLPQPGFLQGLRRLCNEYGSLLIFDEVMTGFRVALGGAQAYYRVQPDLTTLGKVLGGGMPVGAFGGRRDIMEWLAPLGPVYQAGTLAGNPIAMAAGLATLTEIARVGFYDTLTNTTQTLLQGWEERARQAKIPLTVSYIGGMFGLFFMKAASICHYGHVKLGNRQQFQQFFHGMLAHGIYLAPSMFEAGFLSNCHAKEDIKQSLDAAEQVFQYMGRSC